MIKRETPNSLVARYDEAISDTLCDRIVSYLAAEKPDRPDKSATDQLPWQKSDTVSFVKVGDVHLRGKIDSFRFLVTQLVGRHYNTIVYPHFSDLVIWREGMSMAFHNDDGQETGGENPFRPRKYSVVVYLNDNYVGGETVIRFKDGTEYISVPKKGSLVMFKSNDECIHGVNPIKSGTRYTLASWFATDIGECEYVGKY